MITLATLHLATEQEVFDQVATHLLSQGAQSLSIDRGCSYNNGIGDKCASGCLMSDEEYNPKFEDKTWKALVDDKLVSSNHYELISILQDIHDNTPISLWKKELNELAIRYKLKTLL